MMCINLFEVCHFSSFKSFGHVTGSSSSSSRSPDGPLHSSVTSSYLGPPYHRQQPSISVLDVVEPYAAWAIRGAHPSSIHGLTLSAGTFAALLKTYLFLGPWC